jgi:hypothetical protein
MGFILVRIHTLLQCSVDHSIALNVLRQVCLCTYPSERKRILPFYIPRVRAYIVPSSEREKKSFICCPDPFFWLCEVALPDRVPPVVLIPAVARGWRPRGDAWRAPWCKPGTRLTQHGSPSPFVGSVLSFCVCGLVWKDHDTQVGGELGFSKNQH